MTLPVSARQLLPAIRSRRPAGTMTQALLLLLATAAADAPSPTSPNYLNSTAASDCVVTFNEVMYQPPGDDSRLEWIELHNQMSVDVDPSD
jgi:hypothetical protein